MSCCRMEKVVVIFSLCKAVCEIYFIWIKPALESHTIQAHYGCISTAQKTHSPHIVLLFVNCLLKRVMYLSLAHECTYKHFRASAKHLTKCDHLILFWPVQKWIN